jgi:hypothetical protein
VPPPKDAGQTSPDAERFIEEVRRTGARWRIEERELEAGGQNQATWLSAHERGGATAPLIGTLSFVLASR